MIFIINGIFGSSHSKAFLRILIRYTWELPVGGRGSFPVKHQAVCLLFQWKWAPACIFIKYFAYLLFVVWTAVFGELPLVTAFILSTLLVLILHGKKVFSRALFTGWLLINIWYCISYLLNINSALVVQRAFLHRWLIYWCNTSTIFIILVYSLYGFSTASFWHFHFACSLN